MAATGAGDGSNKPAPVDDDTGPITVSPDLRKARDRRAKVPTRFRRFYDFVFVPAEVPDEWTESLTDVHAKLTAGASPPDGPRILAEAQAYFDEAADRIDSAERRATTLQGTVAIAAALVTAGAGLLLDATKIPDRGWRIMLLVVLAGFAGCLVGCALRALGVTGRVFEYLVPGFSRLPQRASLTGEDADVWRAAELLRAGAVAGEIGQVKVGLLRAAAWWLRAALAWLVVFAVLLIAFAASGPEPAPSRTATTPAATVTAPTVTTPAAKSAPAGRSRRRCGPPHSGSRCQCRP